MGNVEGSIYIYWLAKSHIRKWFYKCLWTRVAITLHITLPKPSAISRQNLEVRASHCAALSHQNDNNIAWGQPHWSAIFAVVATSLQAHYSMHVYSDRAAHVVAVAPAAHRSHYNPRRELYVFRLLLLVARLKALSLHAQSSKARCACTLSSWSNKYM